MISNPSKMMYLRPGNLYKDFIVKKKVAKISDTGTPIEVFEDTGNLIKGILAEADSNISERKKHLYDQDKHSLTHTIVSRGSAEAKKGDALIHNERTFIVLLTEDVGDLGTSTIYYAEERNDVK